MLVRVFLCLQSLLFIPYGLYCLLKPEMLAGTAGVQAVSTTGIIELQTMYGGLQISVGVMCTLGALRPALARPALYALLFIFAGLATARLGLGLTHGDNSGYTLFAIAFEVASLLFIVWQLKSSRGPMPA